MTFQKIEHPLDPVYDGGSRFLILGTMPSPVSREKSFYYSHPQNRFWQVLSAVFDVPIPFSIEDKVKLILTHKLALWDVLASCEIKGADDASIKNPIANDFGALLAAAPVERIFTTGQQAYKLYTKLCLPVTGIEAEPLPSTSPANRGRFPLNKLIEEYTVLRTGRKPGLIL
ncbi:DNA-deoxyinosine glycosylase [Treponema brennaborense]|uniref:Uracil-DNA glycosylase-like domain-containing protein n=1 Tax=Treponema brennaborense (strain DSM 12168 / CIP 105900 / DD5/3) TaxID=906968 RepID=F4LKA2_TREBD|nr:DNA-deoxyinosine glycosylase [Treponema brennaborense]AEE15491.1 hypothetical protein Trebr_0032 [Treponema brennaborense DSM 12168]